MKIRYGVRMLLGAVFFSAIFMAIVVGIQGKRAKQSTALEQKFAKLGVGCAPELDLNKYLYQAKGQTTIVDRILGNTLDVRKKPYFHRSRIDRESALFLARTEAASSIENITFVETAIDKDASFFLGEWKSVRKLYFVNVALPPKWIDGLCNDSSHIEQITFSGASTNLSPDDFQRLSHLKILVLLDLNLDSQVIEEIGNSFQQTLVLVADGKRKCFLNNKSRSKRNEAEIRKMQCAFKRLETVANECLEMPSGIYKLAPLKVDEESIVRFEQSVGHRLPAAFRAFLEVRNGKSFFDPIFEDLNQRPITTAVLQMRSGQCYGQQNWMPPSIGSFVFALQIGKQLNEPIWIDLRSGQILQGTVPSLKLLEGVDIYSFVQYQQTVIENYQLAKKGEKRDFDVSLLSQIPKRTQSK